MRDFSKVSPLIWRDRRFRSLSSSDAQLVFLYFTTSEHQNSAGCCRIPDGYAAADLGWDLQRYLQARELVVEAGLVLFDETTSELVICGWFDTNPAMNPKHARAIERMVSSIESDVIRGAAEEAFSAFEEVRDSRTTKQGRGNVLDIGDRLASSDYMTRGRK
ncbi:hypothetical protein ACLE20_14350 [Rhizobium sp. YIM 134829]|uniref:hypothetical protein n=1 Tax=Rhizobium sp. YIM 134829 TaxID=3390453 RepID=UPI00397B0D16